MSVSVMLLAPLGLPPLTPGAVAIGRAGCAPQHRLMQGIPGFPPYPQDARGGWSHQRRGREEGHRPLWAVWPTGPSSCLIRVTASQAAPCLHRRHRESCRPTKATQLAGRHGCHPVRGLWGVSSRGWNPCLPLLAKLYLGLAGYISQESSEKQNQWDTEQ